MLPQVMHAQLTQNKITERKTRVVLARCHDLNFALPIDQNQEKHSQCCERIVTLERRLEQRHNTGAIAIASGERTSTKVNRRRQQPVL